MYLKTFAGKAISVFLLWGAAALSAQQPVDLIKKISLPDVKGKFDHLSTDKEGKNLWLAARGIDAIVVVDIQAGRPIRTISGVKKPTGVCSFNDKMAVASADGGTLNIYDSISFQLIKQVPVGDNADVINFDDKGNRLYVGYGEGGIAVVDGATYEVLARIELDGHPEGFALNLDEQLMYVDVPAVNQVEVVDLKTNKVIKRWTVQNAKDNYTLDLDRAANRAFVGCRKPAKLLVFDTKTGEQKTSFDFGGDNDGLFFDEQSKCLYAVCGEGFLYVIKQNGPDQYQTIAKVPTTKGTRTGYYLPTRKKLFLSVPQIGDQQAAVWIYETKY